MKRKILINCINDISYGGYTYWNNFIFHLSKKEIGKLDITYLCNHNSDFLKYLKKEKVLFIPKLISKNYIFRFFYEQLILPIFIFKKFKFHIYFNGKNIAPILLQKKSVIVIRNIEPFFIQKKYFSLRYYKLLLKFKLTILSLKYSNKIIAVSKNTANIIRKYCNQEIFIIPNGVHVERQFLKWKPNINNPFILNSSKFVPYANQLKLLIIYKQAINMNDKLPNLVLVGGIEDKSYYNRVIKFISINKLDNKIKILGYVTKNKLHEMMAKCKCFIFTSELESCPQTILEAKKIGCPILSSEVEPMPEFLGKNANYLDLKNEYESAIILNNTIKSKTLKKIDTKKNFDKSFDWNKVVDQYLRVF